MGSSVEQIKVWFRFVPREGWYPQDTEGLWATRLSADTAQVQGVPFLQDGVAEGDVVRFQTDTDGLHWAVGRISASGNCTIRVVPVPSGPLGRSPQAVHQRFARFGLGGEVFSEEFPMVALHRPTPTSAASRHSWLAGRRTDGGTTSSVASLTSGETPDPPRHPPRSINSLCWGPLVRGGEDTPGPRVLLSDLLVSLLHVDLHDRQARTVGGVSRLANPAAGLLSGRGRAKQSAQSTRSVSVGTPSSASLLLNCWLWLPQKLSVE